MTTRRDDHSLSAEIEDATEAARLLIRAHRDGAPPEEVADKRAALIIAEVKVGKAVKVRRG